MLNKILSKADCAECKFCCSFRRESLWETPLFTTEFVERQNDSSMLTCIQINGSKCYRMHLENKYMTHDTTEEVPCLYLDFSHGCTLSENDKPFDCKIWPLRVMRKNDDLVIALTPTCKIVNRLDIGVIKSLVHKESGQVIIDYARKYPFVVKPYIEGFPIIYKAKK